MQIELIKSQQFFAQIAEKDGVRDRSAPLALLELEKRALSHSLSSGTFNDQISVYSDGTESDPNALYTLLESYFENFGDKTCCYEDLLPYILLLKGDESDKWSSFLQQRALSSSVRRPLVLQYFILSKLNLDFRNLRRPSAGPSTPSNYFAMAHPRPR
jgi:hypothetical protein